MNTQEPIALDEAIKKLRNDWSQSGWYDQVDNMADEFEEDIKALVEQQTVRARIDELESFYTTVPEATSEWIDQRIKELSQGGKT